MRIAQRTSACVSMHAPVNSFIHSVFVHSFHHSINKPNNQRIGSYIRNPMQPFLCLRSCMRWSGC